MFRYLCGFGNYGVTEDGRVLNHKTNRWLGGETVKGYITLSLRADDGTVLQTSRHRLVATLYVERRDPSHNVVNHLNGVPGDDRAENLEWTTYKGNSQHAASLGISGKAIAVSMRNPKTGETRHYPTATLAGMFVGLTKDAVLWRLSCGENRVFPEGWQYRERNDSIPWSPETDEWWGRSVPVIVADLHTGKMQRFNKQSECAAFLGIALSTLNISMTKGTQRVFKDRYLVKADDSSPWREVGDLLRENKVKQPVVAVEEATGKETIYASAKECADARGLLTTTLNERLKFNGEKVWKDGFRYRRY